MFRKLSLLCFQWRFSANLWSDFPNRFVHKGAAMLLIIRLIPNRIELSRLCLRLSLFFAEHAVILAPEIRGRKDDDSVDLQP